MEYLNKELDFLQLKSTKNIAICIYERLDFSVIFALRPIYVNDNDISIIDVVRLNNILFKYKWKVNIHEGIHGTARFVELERLEELIPPVFNNIKELHTQSNFNTRYNFLVLDDIEDGQLWQNEIYIYFKKITEYGNTIPGLIQPVYERLAKRINDPRLYEYSNNRFKEEKSNMDNKIDINKELDFLNNAYIKKNGLDLLLCLYKNGDSILAFFDKAPVSDELTGEVVDKLNDVIAEYKWYVTINNRSGAIHFYNPKNIYTTFNNSNVYCVNDQNHQDYYLGGKLTTFSITYISIDNINELRLDYLFGSKQSTNEISTHTICMYDNIINRIDAYKRIKIFGIEGVPFYKTKEDIMCMYHNYKKVSKGNMPSCTVKGEIDCIKIPEATTINVAVSSGEIKDIAALYDKKYDPLNFTEKDKSMSFVSLEYLEKVSKHSIYEGLIIKDLKFRGNKMIVTWQTGGKTIITHNKETDPEFDLEKAVYAAITKRVLTHFGTNSHERSMNELVAKATDLYKKDKIRTKEIAKAKADKAKRKAKKQAEAKASKEKNKKSTKK